MPVKAIGRCPECGARSNGLCQTCRGTRRQRGYGPDHIAERARWAPLVEAGLVSCARCGILILGHAPWDLGHIDDRTTWSGPEHQACNRAAAGRESHRR